MAAASKFDPLAFLAEAGPGRTIVHRTPKQTFFLQGEAADSVYYLNKGQAKLTVVSRAGIEASFTLVKQGDFVGEEALKTSADPRLATATALTACTVLRLEKLELLRVIREEQAFADLFLAFMLARSMRTQADLIDQLFNSSEKRLARLLLLMADYGKLGQPETLIPKISQEALAAMVGTTRSRVSYFMNRFRAQGFIEYADRIRVNSSLLKVVLHDQSFESNALSPSLSPPHAPHTAKLHVSRRP